MADFEDKLTPNQRLRLEALSQAQQFYTLKNNKPVDVLIAAKSFEEFIRGETEEDDE